MNYIDSPDRPCPCCQHTGGWDGEQHCTECGFDADKYSIDGYKAAMRRQAAKEKRAKNPPKEIKPRQKQGRKPKAQVLKDIQIAPGIVMFKRGAHLSPEDVERMKHESEERKATFIAQRFARDLDRTIKERIKKEGFTFNMARWKMLAIIREEIGDMIQ